jgi:hypothetical protein
MKDKWVYFLMLCLNFSGCVSIAEKQIIGEWKAVSLKTDSTTYFEEVESVYLNINPGQQYQFTGTLGYQEEGHFELKDSFIFLETNQSEMNPIVLKIKRIQKDTLIIEMKGQQELTFVQ